MTSNTTDKMLSFFIHQKVTAFVNQYHVFDAVGGKPGVSKAFAHQKRFAIKEAFHFYTDHTKQEINFTVKARDILELKATYDVLDSGGKELGRLKKDFSKSLLRSTWQVFAPGGEQPIAIVQERSIAIAVIRRIWKFVPYISDIPFFVKYHFDFIDPASQTVLGSCSKITLLRDHYRLDIADDLAKQCDWRVFVAMGVGLDALQSR